LRVTLLAALVGGKKLVLTVSLVMLGAFA